MISYFTALVVLIAMAVICWVFSLKHNKVDIVDTLWSLMFLTAASIYLGYLEHIESKSWLVMMLVITWSIRLAVHLFIRNSGKPEDRRYQEIRNNNEPNFRLKSLYIVFILQAVLAWLISVPLLFAVQPSGGFHWIYALALVLWIAGFLFEAIGDWQLSVFQRRPDAGNSVLNTGLWRYTRHPNYFGEFCIWWAFYLFALPAGGWWTIYAPLLMSILLLRVSGVRLMENQISNRRPGYAEYICQTNAFFPGIPRVASDERAGDSP